MSRVNHNAGVTIRMKGLAIAHYNEQTKNWEFIFLRGLPQHDLKFIVREYKKDLAAPIENIYLIPVDDERISITTTNAIEPESPEYTTDNFANRVTVDDSRDARWIVDFSEDLHKAPVKLKKKDERADNPVKLTFLSISDAMLYADTLSTKPYQMIKTDNNGQEILSPKIFGGWVGLDIEWKDETSKTDIEFQSLPSQSLVPASDVSIYEIEINNDCNNPQPDEADFHYYYDYLIEMPEEFKDFVQPGQSSPSNNLMTLTESAPDNGNGDGSDNDPTDPPPPDPPKNDCNMPRATNLLDISSLEELL